MTSQGPLWVGGNGGPAEVQEVMALTQIIMQHGERPVAEAAQEASSGQPLFSFAERADRTCSHSGDLVQWRNYRKAEDRIWL